MKLYIVRHAQAEERHLFTETGKPDALRPLTSKGIERMRKTIKNFNANEESIDVFLQSPLLRAQQTVDIFKEFYSDAKVKTTENLCPGLSAKKLYEEIQSYDVDSIAIVGHEPDLGQFLSWLLFRQATDHFPLKKGGLAKLDLYKSGECYLKWLLRPKLLNNI